MRFELTGCPLGGYEVAVQGSCPGQGMQPDEVSLALADRIAKAAGRLLRPEGGHVCQIGVVSLLAVKLARRHASMSALRASCSLVSPAGAATW
jgi:hypothetical protein